MSLRSIAVSLTACAFCGVMLGSASAVRAHVVPQSGAGQAGGFDPGPVGVIFGVEPPVGRATAFTCEVGVRQLVTGEPVLREKFSAEPGKATTFSKTSRGLTVQVEVTIAPGGSEVSYTTSVDTTEHRSLGIHSAKLKLRN